MRDGIVDKGGVSHHVGDTRFHCRRSLWWRCRQGGRTLERGWIAGGVLRGEPLSGVPRNSGTSNPRAHPGAKPPGNRCLIEVGVPMDVWDKRQHARKDPKFPGGWNVHPAGKGSVDYGTAWLAAKTSALLVVPSVVVPAEDNILINPLHRTPRALKRRTPANGSSTIAYSRHDQTCEHPCLIP